MNNSNVYLLNSNNFYKIGRTSNSVNSRLKGIQTSNPNKVILVHSIGSLSHAQSIIVEKQLHDKYNHLNVSGEWFSLNESDLTECINFMDSIIPDKTVLKPRPRVIEDFIEPYEDNEKHDEPYIDLKEVLPENCLWTDVTTSLILMGGGLVLRRMYVHKKEFEELGSEAPLYYCPPRYINY